MIQPAAALPENAQRAFSTFQTERQKAAPGAAFAHEHRRIRDPHLTRYPRPGHAESATRRPRKDSPAVTPDAAYDRACGGTHAQTRQPELGASHPGLSRARHRVRAAGEAAASRAGGVRVVARAPRLVRAEQEPRLRPRVAAPGVEHRRGRGLRPHRLNPHAERGSALTPIPRVPAIRGSLQPRVVGY